jgi:hypothetical protein
VLQFNQYHHRKTEIEVSERLLRDANLLGEAAGVGFFHYGRGTLSHSLSQSHSSPTRVTKALSSRTGLSGSAK